MGAGIRDQFMFEDGVAVCNHGSYGTVPRVVFNERIRLLEEMEKQPDRWFRRTLRPLYDDAISELARFVGASPENIAFVANATTGVNTVVKNLRLNTEDIILVNSHTYGAIVNTVDSAIRRAEADLLELDIPLPIRSEEQIVDLILEPCRRNVSIRLVILCHIASASALLFPVAKIAKELHKLGVLVLVDGAHAPGQLDLNLENLGVDFYTGNLHKWCYCPRGAAFLWASATHRDLIQPLVTSWNYKKSFSDQFFFQGTGDHTTYLCTKPALKFYDDLGGRLAILDHVTPLLEWAQQMLCQALGTSVFPVPPSMQAPYMRLLKLPETSKYSAVRVDAERFMDDLISHNVIGVVVPVSGQLWLRISANVYNCRDDYIKLKDALLQILEISINK